jgi:CRP-like cAMP-binding protein/esterase/lipase
MGGMTSITLALRYPVLVERMVLLSPTITGQLSSYINTVVTPIFLLERFGLGKLLIHTVERAIVGITDRIMRPASFAERAVLTKEDVERLRADMRRPGQARARVECFFAMRDNNLSGKLKNVEPPALIIWGAEDNTVPLRDAGVVADEWPLADLRILPKSGHWPQFEAQDTTRRLVAAYLGLPLSSDKLYTPVGDEALMQIREIAQFLAHSDLGNNLNIAQRTRLAAQCDPRFYKAGEKIVKMAESGNEFYIIQGGTVEVWKAPEKTGTSSQGTGSREPDNQDPDRYKPSSGYQSSDLEKVAVLKPGQITGELSMFDQQPRSADLVAGPEGATILAVDRERLLALCEDDAVLGTQLLWNIAGAMAQRVRLVNWQLQRAMQNKTQDTPNNEKV